MCSRGLKGALGKGPGCGCQASGGCGAVQHGRVARTPSDSPSLLPRGVGSQRRTNSLSPWALVRTAVNVADASSCGRESECEMKKECAGCAAVVLDGASRAGCACPRQQNQRRLPTRSARCLMQLSLSVLARYGRCRGQIALACLVLGTHSVHAGRKLCDALCIVRLRLMAK